MSVSSDRMIVPTAPVMASHIARAVNGVLIGADLAIASARPVSQLARGALAFATGRKIEFERNSGAVIMVGAGQAISGGNSYIEVENPRLAFAKALTEFFAPPPRPGAAASARISAQATLGDGVSVGENVVIEDRVAIGARTVIQHGAAVLAGTEIGDDCLIGPGVVIGSFGFGYQRDAQGIPHHIPHLGGVHIGSGVHVGPNTTIARGTLSDTIVGDHTKIGAQVNIQHNVVVGKACIIASQAQISGSAVIGDRCWLGPNSTLRGVRVGDNAVIGLGALVLNDVPPGSSIMGQPAGHLGEVPAGPTVGVKPVETSVVAEPDSVSPQDELFDQLVREIFKLNSAFGVADDLTSNDIPGWDSISNVELLLETQQRFDVRLDIDDMASVRSIGDLRHILKRHLSGRG